MEGTSSSSSSSSSEEAEEDNRLGVGSREGGGGGGREEEEEYYEDDFDGEEEDEDEETEKQEYTEDEDDDEDEVGDNKDENGNELVAEPPPPERRSSSSSSSSVSDVEPDSLAEEHQQPVGDRQERKYSSSDESEVQEVFVRSLTLDSAVAKPSSAASSSSSSSAEMVMMQRREAVSTARRRRNNADRPASNHSQRSVSYFVDLGEQEEQPSPPSEDSPSAGHHFHPQHKIAWPSPGARRPNRHAVVDHRDREDGHRMTQSLYASRPDSRESNHSAVSFFVDVSVSATTTAAGDNRRGSRSQEEEVRRDSPSKKAVVAQMQQPHCRPVVMADGRRRGSDGGCVQGTPSRGNQNQATFTKKLDKKILAATPLKPPLRQPPQLQPLQRMMPKQEKERSSGLPEKLVLAEKRRRNSNSGGEVGVAEFFRRIKAVVEDLGEDCRSRDEVRAKLRAGHRAEQVMKAEEDRLKKGKDISAAEKIDEMLRGKRRPSSASLGSPEDEATDQKSPPAGGGAAKKQPPPPQSDRPVLRRERTFDLDPGTSLKDAKLVDINLESQSPSPAREALGRAGGNGGRSRKAKGGGRLSREQERIVKVFQQQREYHGLALSREMRKLEAIEAEMVLKTSSVGPEPMRCWGDSGRTAGEEEGAAAENTKRPALTELSSAPSRPVPVPRPRTRIPVAVTLSSLETPTRPARKCDVGGGSAARKEQAMMMTQSCFEGLCPPEDDKVQLKTPKKKTSPSSSSSELVTLAEARRQRKTREKLKLRVRDREEEEEEDAEERRRRANVGRENSGSALSWFIPNDDAGGGGGGDAASLDQDEDEPVGRRGGADSPGGLSLLEHYQAKKKRDHRAQMSSAFFIEVEDDDEILDGQDDEEDWRDRRRPPSGRRRHHHVRPRSGAKVRTRVIDLEQSGQAAAASADVAVADDSADCDDVGINLQEALRRRRPDYIENTRVRENNRLARKMVVADRHAIFENIPHGHHGGGGGPDYYGRNRHHLRRSRDNGGAAPPPALMSSHSTPPTTKTSKTHHGGRRQQIPGPSLPDKLAAPRSSRRANHRTSSSKEGEEEAAALQVEDDRRRRKKQESSKSSAAATAAAASSGSKKYSESPYSQSLSSSAGKKSALSSSSSHHGMPKVQLQGSRSDAAAVKKRKEAGMYRTNRTMTTSLASSAAKEDPVVASGKDRRHNVNSGQAAK